MVVYACIPSALGVWGGWIHLRPGVRDQPGQHGETLSLLKLQKLAGHDSMCLYPSYSGGWGRRIAWTWEAEVVVSWGHVTVLQPECQSKTLSQKNKQTNKNEKENRNRKNTHFFLLTSWKQGGKGKFVSLCMCRWTRSLIYLLISFHSSLYKSSVFSGVGPCMNYFRQIVLSKYTSSEYGNRKFFPAVVCCGNKR